MKEKIVIIGPAYPLRGGLASFDERLAWQFEQEGHETYIYSFSLQYPKLLFPGKTQYSEGQPPSFKNIRTKINSINPFNWIATGRELKKLQPDIILIRFWLPFMGPALGSIIRIAKSNKHTRAIALTDNVIPHEKRPGDKAFTKYFLSACDAFITMSDKVMNDLHTFVPNHPKIQVQHPLYDNFGNIISKEEARKQLNIGEEEKIILFFGFIRKYKGLDILISALKLLKDKMQLQEKKIPKLLIAGEFYEKDTAYLEQIERLGLKENILMHTEFIADEQVKNYLCAADLVVQPYRNATQSGVTPLAYHFEKPMVVSTAGSLPQMVPHKKAGLVAAPNPMAIAAAIEEYFELGESFFLPHLREEKKKFSWSVLTKAVLNLADKIKR